MTIRYYVVSSTKAIDNHTVACMLDIGFHIRMPVVLHVDDLSIFTAVNAIEDDILVGLRGYAIVEFERYDKDDDRLWRYPTTEVINVVDGDTFDCEVDLGFGLRATQRFRLRGADTHELRGGTNETKALAREAKKYVNRVLNENKQSVVRSYKDGGFSRWLGEVYLNDGTSLAKLLNETKYVK